MYYILVKCLLDQEGSSLDLERGERPPPDRGDPLQREKQDKHMSLINNKILMETNLIISSSLLRKQSTGTAILVLTVRTPPHHTSV